MVNFVFAVKKKKYLNENSNTWHVDGYGVGNIEYIGALEFVVLSLDKRNWSMSFSTKILWKMLSKLHFDLHWMYLN